MEVSNGFGHYGKAENDKNSRRKKKKRIVLSNSGKD